MGSGRTKGTATVGYHHSSRRDPERKKRPCISCGLPFMSEWVGNRMCPRCKTDGPQMQSSPRASDRTRNNNVFFCTE